MIGWSVGYSGQGRSLHKALEPTGHHTVIVHHIERTGKRLKKDNFVILKDLQQFQ